MKFSKVAGALVTALVACTAQAAPVQWTTAAGGNDHWYELVNDSTDWNTARQNALASTYDGMTGYLTTVTSQAESDFLFSMLNGTYAWNGGNDIAQEGTWVWADGPEANVQFWSGNQSGTALGFSAWYTNEPNNSNGNENVIMMQHSNSWNDANADGSMQYVVEYGASVSSVPEPESYAMLLAGLGVTGFAARRRKQK
jgi:hypothetical protein